MSNTANPAKEQSIQNVLDMFAAMHDLVYTAPREPTLALFDLYNELAAATPESLTARHDDLNARAQQLRDTFGNISKKLKSAYKPAKIPVSFQVTMNASISKMTEHISLCTQASNRLMDFIDTGDAANLDAAARLLQPFTT